jgi:hypothetical protein
MKFMATDASRMPSDLREILFSIEANQIAQGAEWFSTHEIGGS